MPRPMWCWVPLKRTVRRARPMVMSSIRSAITCFDGYVTRMVWLDRGLLNYRSPRVQEAKHRIPIGQAFSPKQVVRFKVAQLAEFVQLRIRNRAILLLV